VKTRASYVFLFQHSIIFLCIARLFVQRWYMSSGSTSSGNNGPVAIPVFKIEPAPLCVASFTRAVFVGRGGDYVSVEWSVTAFEGGSSSSFSVSLDSVSLSLSREDGDSDYYYYFDDLVPNSGSYSLVLPSDMDTGASYVVRVHYSEYCSSSADVRVLPAIDYTVKLSGE
jgi:hypothetical protein